MNEYLVSARGYHLESNAFGMWYWKYYDGIIFRVTASNAVEACNKIEFGHLSKYRDLRDVYVKGA